MLAGRVRRVRDDRWIVTLEILGKIAGARVLRRQTSGACLGRFFVRQSGLRFDRQFHPSRQRSGAIADKHDPARLGKWKVGGKGAIVDLVLL